MNKTELIEAIAGESGLKKKDAEAALTAFVNAVEGALAKGEKVQLVGFGTFETKTRGAREGRNPKTGETIKIAASKYPAFTAGKAFKDSVNK
ncbi:MAG: HU family DNA-binding protein [Clostridia bacterium]|nr:HU family DNA-binding protein [Clostridia bacterium]